MLYKLRKRLGKIPLLLNLWILLNAFRAPVPVIIQNYRKMHKLKGKYRGKRCFVIGNGPSLQAEDLDKIRNEYSFASNRISRIFDRTSWRPTFYCVQDEKLLLELGDDLLAGSDAAKKTFIRLRSYHKILNTLPRLKNLFWVPIVEFSLKNEGVWFSKRADFFACDGWTVTYMAIELAAYMGFSKIYLLGVDHSFPFERKRDGSVVVKDINLAAHFYESADDNVKGEPPRKRANFSERVTNGYKAAELFSRKDGSFRIYNATRGGRLEVFKRVDLDDVLR